MIYNRLLTTATLPLISEGSPLSLSLSSSTHAASRPFAARARATLDISASCESEDGGILKGMRGVDDELQIT